MTMDGSDANEAAITRYNEEHGTHINYPAGEILQQHHRTGPSSREADHPSDAGVQIL